MVEALMRSSESEEMALASSGRNSSWRRSTQLDGNWVRVEGVAAAAVAAAMGVVADIAVVFAVVVAVFYWALKQVVYGRMGIEETHGKF